MLILIAYMIPYDNSMDNFFNRVLPLGGRILGQEPEAWIGDTFGQRVAGKGKQDRPASIDVDFIKVKGRWYKVKGPVYITKSGRILGWHRRITPGEERALGRWLFSVE